MLKEQQLQQVEDTYHSKSQRVPFGDEYVIRSHHSGGVFLVHV